VFFFLLESSLNLTFCCCRSKSVALRQIVKAWISQWVLLQTMHHICKMTIQLH